MKIKLIILFLLVSLGLQAQPDSLLHDYSMANTQYKNKQYAQAADLYQKILSAGYESPEVFYNLGNAYFKTNNIAKSILYYEKALKLAPHDKDILNNLKYANQFVKDEFNVVPEFFLDRIFNSILHLFNSNLWAIISIISFILSLTLFVIFLFSKIILRRKISFALSFVFLFVTLLSFWFSYQMKDLYTKPHNAIIMEVNTLKSSPENDGTDLFILNKGVKVQIEGENDGWFEVKLPNGKVGWLKKEDVGVI